MTATEFSDFSSEFDRLYAALGGYKQTPAEKGAKVDAYFHALKHLPLREVIAKADTWLGKETKFPKPAEWANVITRKVADVPTMSTQEAEDYRRAERLGYEDAPCGCNLCVEAGVSEKPRRFVPDERQTRDGLANRIVTAGHWAHGFELFRWYQARADFYNRCLEFGLRGDVLKPKASKKSFTERMKEIFSDVA